MLNVRVVIDVTRELEGKLNGIPSCASFQPGGMKVVRHSARKYLEDESLKGQNQNPADRLSP